MKDMANLYIFPKKHLVFLENEHTGEDDFPKMSLFKQKTSFKTLY